MVGHQAHLEEDHQDHQDHRIQEVGIQDHQDQEEDHQAWNQGEDLQDSREEDRLDNQEEAWNQEAWNQEAWSQEAWSREAWSREGIDPGIVVAALRTSVVVVQKTSFSYSPFPVFWQFFLESWPFSFVASIIFFWLLYSILSFFF